MNDEFAMSTGLPYQLFMEKVGAHLELTLDLSSPVEVRDFSDMLGSVADQYDQFIEYAYGEHETDSRFYIKEIRKGSIIVDFAAATIGLMDQTIILKQFFEITKQQTLSMIPRYSSRDSTPPKSAPDNKKHIGTMVRAVAKAEDGKLTLAYKETSPDGSEVAMVVTRDDAKDVMSNIFTADTAPVLKVIEGKTPLSKERRALMRLYQHNQDPNVSEKKRTGHKASVRDIDDKHRTLAYETEELSDEMADIVSTSSYADIIFDVTILEVYEGETLRSYRLQEIHGWSVEED